MKLVEHVMTPMPIAIQANSTVAAARARMDSGRFHHLPVVDEKDRLVGMVCSCDLDRSSDDGLVESVMSSPAFITSARASLESASQKMTQHLVGSLAVVDGDDLVGILTASDVRKAGLASHAAEFCSACGETGHVHPEPRLGNAQVCSACSGHLHVSPAGNASNGHVTK